ncbi:MAG: carbohydrate binding family 9 domain-containing protein, partial [bacterium]|nr:carbohydrate binding family 9 domain-containing protein [bacterium]
MARTALLLLLALIHVGGWKAWAEPALRIPRVASPPRINEFAAGSPEEALSGQLARVDQFIQREPSDGQPASQDTVAFLGFDDENLYVVFVSFDAEPDKVRARLRRRERLGDEDMVGVWLDTFRDQQRAYLFSSNPRGVQQDAMWTEGEGDDLSFDTVWHSEGRLTEQGYAVLFALPFKSLRFPRAPGQTWNIILHRNIPRLNEDVYWPRVSSRVEGYLHQAVPVSIDAAISPGGNFQLIPYGTFRSFRALDEGAPGGPDFVTKKADPDAGVDAKFVVRDSLAVDLTVNPDFSQVESDEPQITVNRRFEVFFPERRPFFQENSNLFATPMDNLVFTRRIRDPEFGARVTGKIGRNAIGAFVIDDTAPGRLEPSDSPHHGQRARFGVFRLQRDLFQQSRLGVLYTERQFAGGWNRVAALDGRLKLARNWAAEFQGVTSATRFRDGRRQGGPAWDFEIERRGRRWDYVFEYNDRSEGFHTQAGLVPRVDIRRIENSAEYRFRPEGRLIAWGPEISTERIWDHRGLRLD